MLWLANWCFVRGHNLLFPHAFYYSICGPRVDERPPDVGPNAAWWGDYKPYADVCRRMSWLNTDSRHICDLAILCEATWLPDKPAKVCFQNQHDFNYLEIRHLWEDATVSSKGVHIAGMTYSAVIIDSLSYVPPRAIPLLKKLARQKHLIVREDSKLTSMCRGALVYGTPAELKAAIDKITDPDIILSPQSENIRYRHVEKYGDDYFMLFNEENSAVSTTIRLQVKGNREWIDPFTAEVTVSSESEKIQFKPYEMKLLRISKLK